MTNQISNRKYRVRNAQNERQQKKSVFSTLKVHDGSVIHPQKYAHGASSRQNDDYFERETMQRRVYPVQCYLSIWIVYTQVLGFFLFWVWSRHLEYRCSIFSINAQLFSVLADSVLFICHINNVALYRMEYKDGEFYCVRLNAKTWNSNERFFTHTRSLETTNSIR